MKKTVLILMVLTSLTSVSFGQMTAFKILSKEPKIDKNDTKVQITVDGQKKEVYKTIEIIQYNYNNQTKTTDEALLKATKDDLYANSIDSPQKRYKDDEIATKTNLIKKLENELAALKVIQDSLYYIYTKDYLNLKTINILNFGTLRSKAFFDYVYGNTTKRFKTLSNSGFSIGDNTGSVYTELVSGNLGLFRVGLGAMVAKNSSSDSATSKNQEAYQKLITYGGNTVLNFEYPLAYLHSKNNQYNFISRLIAKGTADFPAFGTTTDSWAGSGALGLDVYADATLSNNALKFFLSFNINKISGTDAFRDNLGIKNNNFSFGQLTIGLVVQDNIKLSFVVSTFGSEKSLTNSKVVAGGQVVN